jgi:DNA-binding NarL/FixJ family response regulator
MTHEPRSTAPVDPSGGIPTTTKGAIIEDRREIREGLRMLINRTDSYCCGTYRSMEDAWSAIGYEVPDVALVDIGLPAMSGIEGIALLKARHPHMLLRMLTVYDDDERIFDALCAGACGYRLKRTPPARLLEYLKEAVSGGAPISPEIAGRVVAQFREIRPPDHIDFTN